jgi:PAS domain S-box-containing protein
MLRTKIISITILILIVSISLNTFLNSYIFFKEYSETLKSKIGVVGQTLKSQLDRLSELGIPIHELYGFEEQCEEIVKENKEISYAMVLDNDKKILFHSNPEFHNRFIHSLISSDDEYFVKQAKNSYHITLPVFDRYREKIGEIALGYPKEIISKKIESLVYSSLWLLIFSLCLSALLQISSLSLWVTRPINQLLSLVKSVEISGINSPRKIELNSKDELGQLATAFNQMTEALYKTTVSKDYVNNIIETIADALIVTNDKNEIQIINREGSRLLGYEEKELLGAPVTRILPEPLIANPHTGHKERINTLNPDRIKNYETFYRDKYGELIPILLSISEMSSPEGQLICTIYTGKDISERKKAQEEKAALEEQLRQSQKMEAIGKLAGGIAHDFNNVLTVIIGYCDILLQTEHLAPQQKNNLNMIFKATEKAVAFTNQLLAFSRRQVLNPKVVCLNQIVTNMRSMLQHISGEGINLITFLTNNLYTIKVDPVQIERVLLNLTVNAKDAMPTGGELTIRTTNCEVIPGDDLAKTHHIKPGQYVKLIISDTGKGIPPEIQDKIFEPFFTTKSEGEGTGLGLSTVYGIINQSQGYIWVDSFVGKGATFTICLPAVEEMTQSQTKTAGIEFLPKGEATILLVEDNDMVREITYQILKEHGYTILQAHNGLEGLNVIKTTKKIDLLLTDIVMPGINGLEFAEAFLTEHPDGKVLFMSGYMDKTNLNKSRLLKEENFIQKPFKAINLAQKIHHILKELHS